MTHSVPLAPAAPARSPAAAPHAAAAFPIRLGPPEALAAVRALFRRADYTERGVVERLGIRSMFALPRIVDGRTTLVGPVEDANAALVRLLLDAEPLAAATAEALIGPEGMDALRTLGVLAPHAADGALLQATVALVPVDGLWLASDRPPRGRRPAEGVDLPDIVFPAISHLTREFLGVIPDAPGARVIELCAGTGIAALRAARRGAAEAWATDIAERSVHFARFNVALNELDTVTVRQSDVWAGLAGETFDHVLAHPPYVPALEQAFVYRDAGEDGEHVTRRIVEGLPAHLRPGGRCSLTCSLTDRRGAPLEERIRGWLGDAAAEFDVVVLQRRDWDLMNAYLNASGGGEGFRDCERWLRQFTALGIERFVLCSIELRRDARGRAPITVRRRVGPGADPAVADWLIAWRHHLATAPTALERLAGRRPRAVPGAELTVAYSADADGGWRATGATVGIGYPVLANVKAPPLAPRLLELCDGTREVPALLAALRAEELVADDVEPGNVAEFVELLLTAGALESAELPVPRPRD